MLHLFIPSEQGCAFPHPIWDLKGQGEQGSIWDFKGPTIHLINQMIQTNITQTSIIQHSTMVYISLHKNIILSVTGQQKGFDLETQDAISLAVEL